MRTLVYLGVLVVVCLALVSVEAAGIRKKREQQATDSNSAGDEATTPQPSVTEIIQHQLEHHHPVKHWGYRNQDRSILPKEWHKSHPQCYGTQQSPINIVTSDTQYDGNLTKLTISIQKLNQNDNSDTEELWEMKNNGHSVVLTPISHEFSFRPQPENTKYKLLQMHFHWRGSEHYLNAHRYAGELHLVHQNVEDSSKFAVLGFLIKQANENNIHLLPITDQLQEVIKYGTKKSLNMLQLTKLTPASITNYFRYSGSLTTPDCDEIVEWFVINEPLYISDEQLLEFQSIEDKSGYPILTNSRPVQEINERLVRRSFELSKVRSDKSQETLDNNAWNSASSQMKPHLYLFSILALLISFFFY